MNANLYERFRARFASDLGRSFIETASGARFSYADLERESGQIAACLRRLGLEKGDRVAVQVEKSPRALFLYLACLRVGLVYLPLNPAYPEPELDYFLGDAEPALLVCRPESRTKLEPLASRRRVKAVLCLDRDGSRLRSCVLEGPPCSLADCLFCRLPSLRCPRSGSSA